MRKKSKSVDESEVALVEKLRRHPELREGIERILDLPDKVENLGKTADEIEALLIEEVRRLGAETMRDWAQGAEGLIGAEMKSKKPTTYSGKKNE